MTILLEGKRIDSEYEKDWNEIERNIFDQIISLDPGTNLEADKIGPSSKQLLLPHYLDGEVDFLDYAEDVTKALNTYLSNRASYPQPLRNIANFPTVKDFVEFILKGDESDFAKNFDLNDIVPEKQKETPIDIIYNKYYKDLPREEFDRIIALDPETTDKSIGSTAKNFLLVRALKGDEVPDDIPEYILKYNADKDTYPEDKRSIQNFKSIDEFIQYVKSGPETDWLKRLKENVGDEINVIGSTPKYDIVEPLSHRANNAITCNCENRTRGNEYLSWCTGWTNDTSQWNSHSNREWLYCFIDKNKPAPTNKKDRQSSYQLAISKSNYKVYQFLDGNDEAYGDFNNTNQKQNENFFKDFLNANNDIAIILSKTPHVKENDIVKEVVGNLKYLDKPFIYDGPKSLNEFKSYNVKNYCKELIIKDVESIPLGVFSEMPALQKVTFNEGLKVIQAEAFMKDISLNNIQFPSTLERIEAEAFANCIMLKNTIRIPDNLIYIGAYAFRQDHCKLSINKARTKKLYVHPSNKEWFVSHAKGITIQEGIEKEMEITQEINEERLDEKIPPDLARAYQKSTSAVNGIQGHPESEHSNIGSKASRRGVKYNYEAATYEEISKEEAIEYLGLSVNVLPERDENGKIVAKVRTTDRDLFNDRISNLRFIIDGKVIEYEVRTGNTLYLAYWMQIPDRYFAEYPKFKGKYGEENDCRFANKYSDIYTIIMISDKIYKTDEYEHKITGDTPTGKKIRILKVKPNGEPDLDENGRPQYEIVDDTIENRRRRAKGFETISTIRPKDNPSYVPHNLSANIINRGVPKEIDTGAHDITRSLGDTWSLDSATKTLFNNYFYAVNEARKLFKEYDYIRGYIKKVESEREYYEEEEYNNIIETLNQRKDQYYAEYQEAKKKVREAKQKLITSIDRIVLDSNKAFIEKVNILDRTLKELHKATEKQSELSLTVAAKDSPELEEIQKRIEQQKEKIRKQQEEMQALEERKQELLRKAQEIVEQLQKGNIDLEELNEKLSELQQEMDELSDKAVSKKFEKLKELEEERDRLQAELDALAPVAAADRARRASKNRSKELDPELTDIVVFGDSDTESSTETA